MTHAPFFSGPNARLLAGDVLVGRSIRPQAIGALGVSMLAHVVPLLLVGMMIASFERGRDQRTAAADRSSRVMWTPEIGGQTSGGDGSGGSPDDRSTPHPAVLRTSRSYADAIPQSPTAMYRIPAAATIAELEALPGVMSPLTIVANAEAATGSGNGAAEGVQGSGGPGAGRGSARTGFGGDPYHVGNGVTAPVLITEVKPGYTSEALRARIEGTVLIRAVVQPDGSIGAAQVVRSLDAVFGLDREALRAVARWRFKPGTLGSRPVPVAVEIELTFTLR